MLLVVGLGSGDPLDRTRRAELAIARANVIVGYGPYVEMIADLTAGKEIATTGMTHETERCELALRRAAAGDVVALVCSGDAGIYGMAGLAIEQAAALALDVPIEIVAGVTAASTAAARLGAPLMLDFACISLSDLLVPWAMIEARIQAVAAADLAVALYNPRSRRRTMQLERTAEILRGCRALSSVVGIATEVGTPAERIVLSDLEHFLDEEIGMRSIVIVGNSTTRVVNGRMVTPRGYRL